MRENDGGNDRDGDGDGEPVESEPRESADGRDDPFGELEIVDDSGASAEELDELFESVETADLDEEAVWDAVLGPDSADDAGTEASEVDADAGADAVVPKDQYCLRCEHFADPPEVACTRPETDIEELVGTDEFRVRNCPVVVRRGRVQDVFADEE
jgi:hypothetical protein